MSNLDFGPAAIELTATRSVDITWALTEGDPTAQSNSAAGEECSLSRQ